MSSSFVVHKFGGTSVGNVAAMNAVQTIVANLTSDKIAVVVSAMGGKPKVTDLLISLVELAKTKQTQEIQSIIDSIEKKHAEAVAELLPKAVGDEIMAQIRHDLNTLQELLHAISIMRSYNENVTELVSGHGELWSARIMTQVLNHHLQLSGKKERFAFIDSREVLTVEIDPNHGPVVLYEITAAKLRARMEAMKNATHLCITGFICSTNEGVVTTLKRDGSDFSASIFGRVLKAASITIWTDVSGVYSADPRRVPEAKILPQISYQEAMELAYFGAKVIHPKTMAPAVLESIPIFIRNTFDPEHPGTRIYHRRPPSPTNNAKQIVSGFSTIDDLALFNLEGTGMVGVHGVASRLFNALDRIKVNVVLIAQASSERSICFAIPAKNALDAKEAIEAAFFKELHHGLIDTVTYEAPVSIIAAVGDNMSQTPGVCSRFFGALGRAGINILGISQGSSERNISAVVRFEDSGAALRAVHSSFFLADQTISIGIVDSRSKVGEALQNQIFQQAQWLAKKYKLDLRVRAVAHGPNMKLHSTGFDPASLAEAKVQKFDMDQFLDHVHAGHIPYALIVDLSNGPEMVEHYPSWLASNCFIVSSNLHVASTNLSLRKTMDREAKEREVVLDTEACLGMGVPVLSTIQNLLQTGDSITRIETSWSSVMNSLLLEIQNTKSSVATAIQRVISTQFSALSPNDIIDDLTGVASAKKMVLLARELGLKLNVTDAKLDSPIPIPPTQSEPWTIAQVVSYVGEYESAVASYSHSSRPMRMTTTLNATGQGSISIQVHNIDDPMHPFYNLIGAQCGLAVHTDRHAPYPLFLSGTSFASDTTKGLAASSLFSSVLNIARTLG
ncbi:bifunctional aspartokinase/homoserine dehydrogenase [Thraustotheca clavata]|uniref:Bifunctional aspartokinase/homoserine dehydrogenase n=1 Tax=Thraustotheca clavata TaxID=74557 RepID=A0A1V9ZQB1_9STRA|nr:bifunctional aspartokinase/homoserine dehydrogenase [Thraustotheca clavata]